MLGAWPRSDLSFSFKMLFYSLLLIFLSLFLFVVVFATPGGTQRFPLSALRNYSRLCLGDRMGFRGSGPGWGSVLGKRLALCGPLKWGAMRDGDGLVASETLRTPSRSKCPGSNPESDSEVPSPTAPALVGCNRPPWPGVCEVAIRHSGTSSVCWSGGVTTGSDPADSSQMR